MFLFLLFFNLSTQNLSGQYSNAIRTTGQAIAKQTGAEHELRMIQNNINDTVKSTAKKKGLETPLTIVSVGAQATVRKKVQFKTGQFTFKVDKHSGSVVWTIPF